MAINQDISNLPTPPSRSDSPSDFSDKADSFLGALPQLQTELNTYADEANSTQTAVNTSASNAAISEQNAAQSAIDAQAFADAAAAVVDAVAWDAGTTFNTNDAAIGSDGHTYRSLVDNNIGNDPVADDGSNWLQITADPRALILTPENIAPAEGATDTLLTPELEASAYRSLYGVGMASAQWQISEVQDFATTVVDQTVAGTSTTFTPSSNLDTLTTYYWRVRYADEDGEVSEFSEATEFATADIFTDQPTITSPTDGETDIGETPTITSSAFNTVNGSDTHVASEWEITRVSDSVVVFDSGEDTTNLTSIDVPAGVLDEGQESYTVKVRHKGQTFGFSAYSPDVTFTTVQSFLPPPGDAFAGGFIVGVIDTVAGTIDSQDDYQSGERYVLVVSPKSLHSTSDPQWDSQGRSGEAGSFTRWDGLSSTNNILAKNDTSYQAFEHIRSIRASNPVPNDGGSDWYIPAMDELELMYRNLKPQAGDNTVGNSTSAFPGSQNYGFNPSSDPNGSAYTATGEPFQTTVTEFQEGGSEAMDVGSLGRLWSSTDSNDSQRVWGAFFLTFLGEQFTDLKDVSRFNVRPVRRVPL